MTPGVDEEGDAGHASPAELGPLSEDVLRQLLAVGGRHLPHGDAAGLGRRPPGADLDDLAVPVSYTHLTLPTILRV